MKKISIGVNYFGNCPRQNIAKQTHIKIANTFKNVSFYNIQFKDSEENYNNNLEIINLHKLIRSSKDILPNYNKKLPFVKDIFQILAETDCEYFIFTNSDILISPKLIELVNKKDFLGMSAQRLEIHPPTSAFDELKPIRFEIAGVDAFIFNKEWYLKNSHLFDDFLLGKAFFDHCYSTVIKLYGGNEPLLNYLPPYIAHIQHQPANCIHDEGHVYNEKIYKNSVIKNLHYIWDDFILKKILPLRTPPGRYLQMFPNEKEFEQKHFSNFIK